jgi:hypothetical protein
MKRILLVCCLIAASCGMTYAQSSATVSKTEFTTKAQQLNTLIAANKMADSKTKWDEVHKMILMEFAVIKLKIRDAQNAGNEADKKKYTDVMMSQQLIYNDIIKLKEDLAGNKEKLNAKLVEYTAKMI